MKKNVIALAVAAGMAAPAAALADVTLYGAANLSLDNVDGIEGAEQWNVENNVSKVGVKGKEDLGNGLYAKYKFEWGVNVVDSGDAFSRRNQFVGLGGGFGEFRFGRHDTPLKKGQGSFDRFNWTAADINDTIPGEDRVDNVLAYITPSFGGFNVLAAVLPGEDEANDVDGIADHYSVMGMYNGGGLFASLAYNSYDLGANVGNGGHEPSLMRAVATYGMGPLEVGAIWADFDADGLGDALGAEDDSTSYGLSGAFDVTDSGTIKAQWLASDDSGVTKIDGVPGVSGNFNTDAYNVRIPTLDGQERSSITVGYDHSMSKRTKLYAFYKDVQLDDAPAGAEEDGSVMSLGVMHSF